LKSNRQFYAILTLEMQANWISSRQDIMHISGGPYTCIAACVHHTLPYVV